MAQDAPPQLSLAIPAPLPPLSMDVADPPRPRPPRSFLPSPPPSPPPPSPPLSDSPGTSPTTPTPTSPTPPPSESPPSTSVDHTAFSSSISSATSSSSVTTASSSSLPPVPPPGHGFNVKFAPLPHIAPRKRRSTAPLGMAARGALVRARRGAGGGGVVIVDSTPTNNGHATNNAGDSTPTGETLVSVVPQAASGAGWPAQETAETMTLTELRWRQEQAAARFAQSQAAALAVAARALEAEIAADEAAREAKARMKQQTKGGKGDDESDKHGPFGVYNPNPRVKGEEKKHHFWRRRTTASTPALAAASAAAAAVAGSSTGQGTLTMGQLRHRKSADAPLRPILAPIATNTARYGQPYAPSPMPGPTASGRESPAIIHDLGHRDTQETEQESREDPPPRDSTSTTSAASTASTITSACVPEGQVWPALAEMDIPEGVGQTQTIVEGRAVKGGYDEEIEESRVEGDEREKEAVVGEAR